MGLYDDLLHNFDAKVIAGGGSNIGRGAQYMLSPDSVFFIGCIGDDKYGERLVQECHQAGMHTEFRIDDTAPTGRCGVVITGHHRSLCTHLAAANEYRLDHLQQPRVWSMVQRSKIIYVEGYHVTVCVPAIISLAEEALASSKTFIFNFCAPFIPGMFGEPLAEILPYTDYVLGNETEARTWAASQGHAAESVTEIARLLVAMPTKKRSGVRTVIITQGSGPTITAEKHRDGRVELNEYPVHKIAEEEIKDTNGAGYVRIPKSLKQTLIALLQ
jgi:adenosine kinase